jgi:hypothetical protein
MCQFTQRTSHLCKRRRLPDQVNHRVICATRMYRDLINYNMDLYGRLPPYYSNRMLTRTPLDSTFARVRSVNCGSRRRRCPEPGRRSALTPPFSQALELIRLLLARRNLSSSIPRKGRLSGTKNRRYKKRQALLLHPRTQRIPSMNESCGFVRLLYYPRYLSNSRN